MAKGIEGKDYALPDLRCDLAILDIKEGRRALNRHLAGRPSLGPCPEEFRVPVALTGYIENVHSRDDGNSQEFSVHVDNFRVGGATILDQPWKARETFSFDLDEDMVTRLDALADRCEKQGCGILASANYHGQGVVEVPAKWLRALIAGYRRSLPSSEKIDTQI